MIGTETYLKDIKKLDLIVAKMNKEGWDQEINNIDD